MTQASWDGKGTGSAAGNKSFLWIIRHLGIVPAYLLLLPVCLSYALTDEKTKTALSAFRQKLGLESPLLPLYRHILSFGMSLVDRMAFLLRSKSPFTYDCINEEYITGTIAQGKGAILLGAHVGNWEVAGNLLVDRIQTPVHAIMLDAEREELQAVYRPAMDQRRIHIIPMSANGLDTVVQAMACIRKNEILALLGDRVLDQQSERIPFLGSPAAFPKGPFVLAALTGAPIIPVFALKKGLFHYRFVGYEPIVVKPDSEQDRDRAILQAMKTYVSILEKVTRENPFQWFNFYKFWG
jgi:predicted LPLAT superfamily acyltransferase